MRNTVPFFMHSENAGSVLTVEDILQIVPKIEDALTGSLLWYSQNAQYVPNSIKIISVEHLSDSRYKLHYSFKWNVFNACLDIDAEQTTSETVNFEWHSDALIFDFIDNERASVADEL